MVLAVEHTKDSAMPQVIIVGSINMDVVARTAHHPLPGETILGSDLRYIPGGKGSNQAVAAARAGGDVRLVGRLGGDAFGSALRQFLGGEQLDLTDVRDLPDHPTGVAIITVSDAGENSIVVIAGSNGQLHPQDIAALQVGEGDTVVTQLEIPLATVSALLAHARQKGARTLLNPSPYAPLSSEVFALCDVLVLNEIELGQYSGREVGNTPQEAIAAAQAFRAFPEQIIVVTLGGKGLVAVSGEETVQLAARPVKVVDTTGAGDCFTGTLAVALSEGKSLQSALTFANAAAALSVQKMGASASLPTRGEIEGSL
jgi:ribokinase